MNIIKPHVFAARIAAQKSVAALLAALFLLGSCASPPTHEGMVPTGIAVSRKLQETVRLNVSGGAVTADGPGISNAALEAALNQAISESRLFSQVVKGNGGDYLLTANVFALHQPMFGMAMTVSMEVGWTLKRMATDKVVWQEGIRSEHTSTPGEAFAGVTRVRLATEGAAKNNIAAAMARIAAQSL
jgi:hypothetical protein